MRQFDMVRTCFAEIKFCSVQSRFSVHLPYTNFGQYWLSTIYFLGDFNELSDHYFFMPIRCAKFRWKISKYKICHFWHAPLAATEPLWNIFFITEWITLKLKILTDIKPNFFTIDPVDISTQKTHSYGFLIWFKGQVQTYIYSWVHTTTETIGKFLLTERVMEDLINYLTIFLGSATQKHSIYGMSKDVKESMRMWMKAT
jgi:hypothetical protein